MSYIEASLGQGERVIARAKFHWSYSARAWLALILLFWCVIGVWIFFAMMIRKWTTEIAVTTHRFVEKTGFLAVRTNELAIHNIEGVRLTQGFFGHILGYGHIRIEGTGVDAIELPTIANPVAFRAAIETARESEKRA